MSKAHREKLRLVLILAEPVKRLMSRYSHLYRISKLPRGEEDYAHFNTWIFSVLNDEVPKAHVFKESLYSQGFYADHISRILAYYHPSQVFIINKETHGGGHGLEPLLNEFISYNGNTIRYAKGGLRNFSKCNMVSSVTQSARQPSRRTMELIERGYLTSLNCSLVVRLKSTYERENDKLWDLLNANCANFAVVQPEFARFDTSEFIAKYSPHCST